MNRVLSYNNQVYIASGNAIAANVTFDSPLLVNNKVVMNGSNVVIAQYSQIAPTYTQSGDAVTVTNSAYSIEKKGAVTFNG